MLELLACNFSYIANHLVGLKHALGPGMLIWQAWNCRLAILVLTLSCVRAWQAKQRMCSKRSQRNCCEASQLSLTSRKRRLLGDTCLIPYRTWWPYDTPCLEKRALCVCFNTAVPKSSQATFIQWIWSCCDISMMEQTKLYALYAAQWLLLQGSASKSITLGSARCWDWGSRCLNRPPLQLADNMDIMRTSTAWLTDRSVLLLNAWINSCAARPPCMSCRVVQIIVSMIKHRSMTGPHVWRQNK